MLRFASRTERLRASATLAFQERVRILKASGDVIALNAGEPDFDVPMNVKAQAIEAIHEGRSKYTDVRGVPELIEAIAEEYRETYGFNYQSRQIIVTNGAKQALFNGLLCLIERGDEVIVPAPFWPSYYDMISVLNGLPVIVPTHMEDQFLMSPSALEAHITPKTKCIIFNSPSNPTGQCIPRALFEAYAEILRRHPHIAIISDDVYESISWNAERTHWLQAAPDMADRTLIVSGLSKSYAMTGWRLGYALGPSELIKHMVDYQSQSTSNVCSIAQYAGIEALTGDRYSLAEMLIAYKRRHDMMYSMLTSDPRIRVLKSQGTFYLFPDLSEVIQQMDLPDADALSLYCLEKAKVCIMSGVPFGGNMHLRFSFANKYEKLSEGLERFLDAISRRT